MSSVKTSSEIGFAVTVGVLIDTLVVRSLIVPAATMLLGEWALWPGAAGGYRALGIRPRITVREGHETWKRFATTRTTGDIAAARVALDPLLAGVGAKP